MNHWSHSLNWRRGLRAAWVGSGFAAALLVIGCTGQSIDQNDSVLTAWKPLPALPAANGGFIAGVVNDHVLILGGTNWVNDQKYWLEEIHCYSAESDGWQATGTLRKSTAYASYGSDGRGLYWLGGSDGGRTSDSLFSAVSPDSVRHIADTGYPVVYAGAAVYKDGLYVIAGGSLADDLQTLTDRFVRVSLSDGRIEELPPYPGGPVMLPAVVCLGDELLVFGGARYDTQTAKVVNTRDAYAYSMMDRAWRRLAPLPCARRGMAGCVLSDRSVLLSGGYGELPNSSGEDFAKDTYHYNMRLGRYTPSGSLPYAAMGHVLIRHNDLLYLAGGEDKPRHRTDQFYLTRVQFTDTP